MSDHAKPSTVRDEPIRVFKSDFMEFFTHISPIAVLVVWLPIVAAFLALAILRSPYSGFPWQIIAGFIGGLAFWTLAEYSLHRFLFHHHAKSEWGKRINFMFHGIHHAQPMVKTRLVMPPIVSIPLGLIFIGIYWLVFAVIAGNSWWLFPCFAGTALGYVGYDMTHYATHHFNLKNPWFKWVRAHHMKHHVQTPDARFGVTSNVWDMVFHTEPEGSGTKGSPKSSHPA